ncbi:MAG: 4Fe-4S dicluster domain-containing protein [Chloroflexi bacterium]|nr:4Fe-4S dicluster domain-containing protein [Chloroflexota bacterium]
MQSQDPGGDEWDNWDRILNPDRLPVFYDHFEEIEAVKPKHHWVMVIDLRKCIGCQSCTVACKSENGVPLGSFRTWVDVSQIGQTVPASGGETVTESGTYQQQIKVLNIPKLCNHCDEPPCVEVCPVKATFKRADGLVLVDPRLCIGCGTCVNACPYGARYLNPVSRTADKCTFCVQRIDQGLLPACVTSCVGHARIFGDLNDPTSEVSKLISQHQVQVRKPEMGTDPQVFYIGLDGTLGVLDDPAIQHLVYTYAMNTNSTAYRQLAGSPAAKSAVAAGQQ